MTDERMNEVKLGFIGVYIILFVLKNIDCGHSLEPILVEAILASTHNLCFEPRNMKNIRFFFIGKISIFGGKLFSIFE